MKTVKLIFSLLLASSMLCAQTPETRLSQLTDQAHADLVNNILPFWLNHSQDPSGGFYGSVFTDGTGNHNTDKGSILCARILWTFSEAYRRYGNPAHKQIADRAAEYYMAHFIDYANNRVYWSVTPSGAPSDLSSQTYAMAYGIYGLAAHYQATNNSASLTTAQQIMQMIESQLHDSNGGWYERIGSTEKMHNPHIHILESYTALYKVAPDEQLARCIREALDILRTERYATTPVDYGHKMEMAWLMTDAAYALADEELIIQTENHALTLADQAMAETRKSGEWWPWCETILGSVNAWQISGNVRYLREAEAAWDTIRTRYIDKKNGGWHKIVRRNGQPAPEKGSVWFGPYHNSRITFRLEDLRQQPAFRLYRNEYFRAGGSDVMAFSDFYPEGHQGGITIIMNGRRLAANGDIRMEPTPGQWQPVPKQLKREVTADRITTTLCFPDSSRHLTGFNPMVYPNMQLRYTVTLTPQSGGELLVSVNLSAPIPAQMEGRVGFNLELFPGEMMGRPYLMDNHSGIFPQQPNAPVIGQASYLDTPAGDYHQSGKPIIDMSRLDGRDQYSPISADHIIAGPYAEGHSFTCLPDDSLGRFTILSGDQPLQLYDGRMNHNNGWFVLRSPLPTDRTGEVLRWTIRPSVCRSWHYPAVVQVSQVGYHPQQDKVAIIERDIRDTQLEKAVLYRITEQGKQPVSEMPCEEWSGQFLRYRYARVNMNAVTEPGLYQLQYANSTSTIFRIGDDVYDRGVWQPVIEYFLPVQMCHMRVNEKYRVWHDHCHMDDALMAHPGNLFDGYNQEADNHTHYQPGEQVPGLNCGGWHDAGDFDLRVESQAGECYILSMAYEQFHPQIDATSINQQTHTVEIHQPDGKNDILQQIEHGALSVVGGYKALGRLYRGIICNSLRQYVMLGDASAMTDGQPGNEDDRWVYTEVNPARELTTSAHLAATSRALTEFNPQLSRECLQIAVALFDSVPAEGRALNGKLQAAAELYITTREQRYLDYILQNENAIMGAEQSIFNDQLTFSTTNLSTLSRVEPLLRNMKDKRVKRWLKTYHSALEQYSHHLANVVEKTPYGVPYEPSIWGAGWDIQRFGFENYFLANAYPDLFPKEPVTHALDFILGCHPGSNRRSFAGGIGSESTTVGYGLNRADWSYIPGGVVSGTALIRPDLPELLVFPYLWQQVEYVLGGGSSHYMFLVLATRHLLEE